MKEVSRRDFFKLAGAAAVSVAGTMALGGFGVARAASAAARMDYVTLNNGVQMPLFGYGTLKLAPEQCADCVAKAIQKGYRLIDTARNYSNEIYVGEGIKKSGVSRKELFVTSKLWFKDGGYEGTKKAFALTLKRLGLDYLDLYLIHQPFGDVYGTWRAMEELYEKGKIRAIGVSNFYDDRLVDFVYNNKIKPAVNQIEMNPYHQQWTSQAVNEKYGVQLEAWGPLGQGKDPALLEEPTLAAIGKKYGKTPAQVILRWLTQRGVVTLCKTQHEARMTENLESQDFRLSAEDMASIKALDTGKSMFGDHRDPDRVVWFMEKSTRPLPAGTK